VALLRKTIGQDRVREIWSQAINTPEAGGRPCPICNRGMTEVFMGIPGETLNLGVCKRCEFVWFDPAEYQSIPPAPPAPTDPSEAAERNLPQAAREALAVYQVQKIAEQARAQDPEPDETWKTVPALLGLPVELDSDPLAQIPWATFLLAATITLISIWAFFDLKNAVEQFGLIPDQAWRDGGLTFLTSFFIHAGILHLASNLYFLIIFGIHVENYLGWKRWLLLVTLAATAGNLLHVMADPRGAIPCIGASGGISGLIAFYALKFPHARLGILFRYFFTSNGFSSPPGLPSFFGWCCNSGAPANKSPGSAMFRQWRIWGERRWVFCFGSFGGKPRRGVVSPKGLHLSSPSFEPCAPFRGSCS
jgi:membrane associated rhomboid family serine protease